MYLWGEGGVLNYVLGVLPFVGSLGLVFFELLIASLQAYVFVLLPRSTWNRHWPTRTEPDLPHQSTSAPPRPHHLARTGAVSD